MTVRLFIGNKNYSSWSLRPWLVLRWARIPFEETVISLAQEGYGEQSIADVVAVSPNGRVPALHVDGVQISDSLAIAEWAAEQVAADVLWPTDPVARALGRSATAEMHSGFMDLRDELPMNINRRVRAHGLSEGTQRDIGRVISLWSGLRERFANRGPWLFGQRSIADAFYAPVVTRLRTYGIELPETAMAYSATVLSDADFLAWEAEPVTDTFAFIDNVFSDDD